MTLRGILDLRLARVVARVLTTAAWIFRDAACLWRVGLVLLRVPIDSPLPDIADHVVDAVAVCRKRQNRRSAVKPIFAKILERKISLPGVGAMHSAGRKIVAPRELGSIKPAARGKLPLSFGRQILAGPLGIGFGVAVRDMNGGMIVKPADRAPRPIGPPPIGAGFEIPPLRPVAQIDGLLRRRENHRSGFEHMRQGAGIILRVRGNFRERDVTGFVDEFPELPIGDRSTVDPEIGNAHTMRRRLFGIMFVRPHAKRAAGNKHHLRRAYAFHDCRPGKKPFELWHAIGS